MNVDDPDIYTSTERFALWRKMVDADAVVWSGPGSSPNGFWSVFSHEACGSVLSPKAPFTSEYGMLIGFDAKNPDRAGGRMLVATDGDRHTFLRRLINPYLTRTRIHGGRLQEILRRELSNLLDRARQTAESDIAKGIGPRIPSTAICEILGIPTSDREWMIELTDHAFGGADATLDKMPPDAAHSEILMYFHDLIAERRRRPGDDLVSAMLRDGELTPDDVLLNCENVLIGGTETTTNSITGTFYAAAQTPDLLDQLRAHPDRLGLVVEEIIRWTSPVMHVMRVPVEDVTLNGQPIAKGTAVVCWLAAANRDSRVFAEPDRFVPHRKPNRHLGLGHGIHHCIGAALARMELRLVLETLAERVASVELVAEPRWLRSVFVQGYRRLPVRFTWR